MEWLISTPWAERCCRVYRDPRNPANVLVPNVSSAVERQRDFVIAIHRSQIKPPLSTEGLALGACRLPSSLRLLPPRVPPVFIVVFTLQASALVLCFVNTYQTQFRLALASQHCYMSGYDNELSISLVESA